MPKRRVMQEGERAADADAAALVVTFIIANSGGWICGKTLLLESGEQNVRARKGRQAPGRTRPCSLAPLVFHLLLNKMNRTEEPGRYRFQVIHILRIESPAISGSQRGVIPRRLARKQIDRSVINMHFDFVFTVVNESGDIDPVRWMPERAGSFAIHKYDGRFANGRIEKGQHAACIRRSFVHE